MGPMAFIRMQPVKRSLLKTSGACSNLWRARWRNCSRCPEGGVRGKCHIGASLPTGKRLQWRATVVRARHVTLQKEQNIMDPARPTDPDPADPFSPERADHPVLETIEIA